MFGKDGEVAVNREIQQLQESNMMIPIKHKEITYYQKKEALGYLMFFKHKDAENSKVGVVLTVVNSELIF